MSMLTKLRLQFILIASLAVSVILISFVGLFNSARYVQNTNEIDTILTVLSENNGTLPSSSRLGNALQGSGLTVNQVQQLYYFHFILDKDFQPISSDVSHLQEVMRDKVATFYEQIDHKEVSGFVRVEEQEYAYRLNKQSGGQYLLVAFDATSYIDDRSELFDTSLHMSLYSLVFFVIVVFIFSGRAIKPYKKNLDNQKRFITNAGHELKTPLAIISANTEMQELLEGETEWSKSTKDQVARLTELINRMVTLAKLEEQPDLVLSDVDFSAIAQDAAEDFKAPVIKDNKAFIMDIAPGIHAKAEEKSLFELVTILVDNANKYCDVNGTVSVRLSQTSLRKARLEVSNTYAAGKDVDYSKFFNRFYREDESHNNAVAGYGIGLSMAESIVKVFKGKITASYKGDTITFRVVL